MKRVVLTLLAICAMVALSVPGMRPVAAAPLLAPRLDVDAPAVPGEFLIKFRPGTRGAERRAAVAGVGGRFFDRLDGLGIDAFEVPALKRVANPRATKALITRLKRNPNVAIVEPNFLYNVNYTPNDPDQSQQWGWGKIDAYSAWETTQGSSTIVVAIIDSGIESSHPDLDAKMVPGYDFVQGDTAPDDGNGHGTHVAGTVAAETNNGIGGAGMCPNCRLMPIRVLDNNGNGTLLNVAKGIYLATIAGAKVINLSLGGGGSLLLWYVTEIAWSKGVFLACAAGNENTNATATAFPAAFRNCFAVASTTSSDERSSFSNYGAWVEVAAPGSTISSTWIGGGYRSIDGTSMATPHVAGLAGLLASEGLTNVEIRQRLCDTAEDIPGTGSTWTCGRINARRAVQNETDPPPPPSTGITNGDFEAGPSGWLQMSSGGEELITRDLPRTGAWSAYLGGYDGARDSIVQSLTVPSNGTLTYWWRMSTLETAHPYDFLTVELYSPSVGWVNLRTWSDGSIANTWNEDSIDLAGYAGQAVTLRFSVATDGSNETFFFIDDVSLE